MDIVGLRLFFLVMASCAARVLPIYLLVPFLGGQVVPAMIRNTIIVSQMLLVYPCISRTAPPDLGFSPFFVGVLLKEAVLGVLLGFLASLVFWVAMSVGNLLDNQRGASMAQGADPLAGEMNSPTGTLLLLCMVALFVTGGGFLRFTGVVLESYRVWPVYSFFPNFGAPAVMRFFAMQLNLMMTQVVLLAGPMVVCCFLVDFCMGLMNRFAPQLNVFFLSMPIKSGVGLFVLVVYLHVLYGLLLKDAAAHGRLLPLLNRLFS